MKKTFSKAVVLAATFGIILGLTGCGNKTVLKDGTLYAKASFFSHYCSCYVRSHRGL